MNLGDQVMNGFVCLTVVQARHMLKGTGTIVPLPVAALGRPSSVLPGSHRKQASSGGSTECLRKRSRCTSILIGCPLRAATKRHTNVHEENRLTALELRQKRESALRWLES
jgi:hypothetical protein